jgi:5-methylcytosine-specific restriction protein A
MKRRWQSNRPAWEGSDRKSRLPADWDRLRLVVLRACGNRCEWIEDGFRCHNVATDVDHRIPGDDHSLVNLQGLCNPHHLTKTGREVAAARAKIKEMERLPEEPQPGIIDGPPTPTEHKGF